MSGKKESYETENKTIHTSKVEKKRKINKLRTDWHIDNGIKPPHTQIII